MTFYKKSLKDLYLFKSNNLLTENWSKSEPENAIAYESTIIDNLNKLGISGKIRETTGNVKGPDADITINDKIYNLEIKMNPSAKMGTASIKYNEDGKEELKISNSSIEEEMLLKLIYPEVKKYVGKMKEILHFVNATEPQHYKDIAHKIPFQIKDTTYEKVKNKGLTFSTDEIPYTVDYISDFYNKKNNTYYIQIGEAGLFYMNYNPANLPIPKLQGEITFEISTDKGGNKSEDRPWGTFSIRIYPRLVTENVSPYTLDDIESIKKMLQHMKK